MRKESSISRISNTQRKARRKEKRDTMTTRHAENNFKQGNMQHLK
jgi:hypothetical protein